MGISLGFNQYGKAECRLVHVDRSTAVHRLTDLTVTSQLTGDFADTHHTGDNAKVIATDTQKNTVYALARRFGVGAPEDFALRLARYFVDGFEQVSGARQEVLRHPWDRVATSEGGPHGHTFARSGTETRTCVVTKHGADEVVLSGLTDLVLLKSTGSEFHGFPDVPYTSLVETDDRIMATSVTARWRYAGLDVDTAPWDFLYGSVKKVMLEQFATVHSLSLQQTMFAMGQAALELHPEIAEIRLSCPNKHHFLVDLTKWDLDNPNIVFYAADRPYGLIEASVIRDDAEPAGEIWEGINGFV
jgi:urate oxidase